ncbi:MAG: Tar ligand binding domain-containing protein, partial [Planctomycetaceae bacterium]|nr:Tar ligand binding domain-containing protein [Planctomycetaceae bacterium]
MLQRMKISGKLILGFGLIALLLIVSAFVIFRSLMRIQTDTDYMVELARVSDDTNNVLVKILESRLSFNRVIANGNSDERGLAIGKAKEALDAVNQIASDLKIREIAEKLNELQDILKKFNTSTVVMLDYYINQHKEWNQQLATIENIKDLFDKSGQLGDLKSGNAARDAVIAFIGKFALSQDIEQQRGIVKSLNEKLDAFSSDITGLIASEKDASATATLKNMLGDISEYKKSVQRCLDFSEKIAAAKKEREVVAAKSVQLSDELSSYTTKLVLEKNDTLDTILNYYTVIIMTISMVTLFSVILIGLWLRNSVAVSLSKIVNVMKKVINEGDISVDIEDRFSHRYDEIGDLAKATESILDDYRSVTDLGQAAISGDWTHQIRIKSDKDVMNKNLDAMMEQVNIVLSKVTRSSADVLNGAQQVSNVSESLSQGATETAASLEEISASMHEMGSQTQKNADNAGEANSLARMASTSAESGQKMM